MEIPHYAEEKDKIEKKKIMQRDETNKEEHYELSADKFNVHKLKSNTRSMKRSEKSEELFVEESHKRHCNWKRSISNKYCSSSKLSKYNDMCRKIEDGLKNYVTNEMNIFDLSQENSPQRNISK